MKEERRDYFTLRPDVLRRYRTGAFIETGTWKGAGIRAALECGFAKVISIDIDPNCIERAEITFPKEVSEGAVQLVCGDAAIVFSEIMASQSESCTLWLDGHCMGQIPDLPQPTSLYSELEALALLQRRDHIVMVDDIRLIAHRTANNGWGEAVDLPTVVKLIRKINSNYRIIFEDGFTHRDVLVAIPF